jgi:hypothetical protein
MGYEGFSFSTLAVLPALALFLAATGFEYRHGATNAPAQEPDSRG